MKNYLVFYTDHFIPQRFSGLTFAFLIFLRPYARDKVDLLEHEKVHVNQFWRTLGFNGVLYLFKKYRLQYELEAYRKQLEVLDGQEYYKQLFAQYLSTKYNLDITYEDALKLL